MRYLLFFCCFLVFIGVNAQVKPIYFVGDQITIDKDKATSYAIYGKLSTEDLWVIKRYDLWDNLMLTGSYKDELLTIAHGAFTFYDDIEQFNQWNVEFFNIKGKTRFKSQEGSYVNGLEQGRWTRYFPDGNVFAYSNFVDGKLNGTYKVFDRMGKEQTTGNYVNGEMDGEWLFDKGKLKKVYENGILKSTVAVKKPKKIKATVNKS